MVLIFVCVANADLSITRVKERVARGGHHVPDLDVRRRYTGSIQNLRGLLKVVDRLFIYDNSESELNLILEAEQGNAIFSITQNYSWAKDL